MEKYQKGKTLLFTELEKAAGIFLVQAARLIIILLFGFASDSVFVKFNKNINK